MLKKALAAVSLATLCSSAVLAETVKTDFFTVDLKDGWVNLAPIKEVGPSYQVAFANQQLGSSVNIIITPDGKSSAKADANGSNASFKKKNPSIGKVQQKDDMYYYTMSMGQAKGIFYAVDGDDITVSFMVLGDQKAGYQFIDSFTDCDEEAFRAFE